MPDKRTVLSEICTALGIADMSLRHMGSPSEVIRNVSENDWATVQLASNDIALQKVANSAWENGNAFRNARQGLRGRPPLLIEWKGPHKPPGYEYIPADIRVDHVYLVSCKYGSQILMNSSPAHLFDRLLGGQHGHKQVDWYNEVASDAYTALYVSAIRALGITDYPDSPNKLSSEQGRVLSSLLQRQWPGNLLDQYRQFSLAVSTASAQKWQAQLRTKLLRESMLWRLLRLADAPYFLLGVDRLHIPICVMIGTPWDWRHDYEFLDLVITAQEAGQPLVCWQAHARDRSSGEDRSVRGHIEIRWRHGKFNGFPEAKVYLDTPHRQVPGYYPLHPH